LPTLRTEIGTKAPLLLLSATVSKDINEELLRTFKLNNLFQLRLVGSRPNLELSVRRHESLENTFELEEESLKTKPTVIFVNSVKKAKAMFEFLLKKGKILRCRTL